MINFSTKEKLSKLINIEKSSLNSYLTIQKSLNTQILSFFKNFVSDIKIDLEYDSDNILFNLLNEASSNLKKTNENIKKLEKLLKKLEKIDDKFIKETKKEKLEELIKEYNKNFESSVDTIFKDSKTIENFIHKIATLNLDDVFIEISKKSSKNTIAENENTSSNYLCDEFSSEDILENTLVISETEKKVFLPYTIEEIKDILLDDNNNYHSVKEVIDNIYTKPLKSYSPSAIARFRETYKLVTKKEKQSKLKAISLANELFFNFNLHPAIISACKSLDELDIYLACLEDNCLDDFKYFDVKFEVPPTVVANSKITI